MVQEGFRALLGFVIDQTGAQAVALYVRLSGTRRYVLAGEFSAHSRTPLLPHGIPALGFGVSFRGEKISQNRVVLGREGWHVIRVPLRYQKKFCAVLFIFYHEQKSFSSDVLERLKKAQSLWSALASTLIATAKVASEWEACRAFAVHWRFLLNTFPFALILLDGSGRALLSNEPARSLLQLSHDQVPGEEWGSLLYRLPGEIRPAVARAVEKSLGGVPYQEMVFAHQGRRIRIHALPLARGEGSQAGTVGSGGCVLLLEDFTSAWERERQLQEAKRLAEIGQMTATLAHELRNPLTSIRGAAQLIREEVSSPRLCQWADIIEEEAEEMDAVLSECLELAKPPQLLRKPVALASVVERILRQQTPVFQKVGIRVVWEKPLKSPQVLADGIQLGQALRNLIRNSIQAMPSGGEVHICIGEDSGEAFIVLEDTGIGIPKEIQDKVFTPFFTTKVNGTGLGLCNVKRVVEAHGGSVSLESEPGKGTRFILRLPCHGGRRGFPKDAKKTKREPIKRGR